MSPIVALLIAISFSVCGEMLLKVGMNQVGNLDLTGMHAIPTLIRAFTTPAVLIGFILIFGGSLFWLSVLSKAHLSWAYPMLSMSYILVVFLSAWLLNEPVTAWRIAGVLTIIAGVFMVYRS
ncbi:MAG: EamA family transporter [Anaerolineae bacterium]|nr:EamA family transporter [Anaerolineae bacterium]